MRFLGRTCLLMAVWVNHLQSCSPGLARRPSTSYRPRVHPSVTRRLVVLGVVGVVVATATALPAGIAESAAAAVPVATTAPSVTVSPDPQHDLYVGDGGLVVPSADWRGDEAGRRSTASCLDCSWRVSVLCTKAEAAAGRCQRIDLGCPVGTVPVRIWLLRPGADWAVVGRACQGPSTPVTVTGVGTQVHDTALAALPPLRAQAQPEGAALVRVPVLFRTGQPADGIRHADLPVLGLTVVLDARVRWHWAYGDGTDAWTSSPGGTWPDTSVSHAYRGSGEQRASVEAVWRAEFTVEGLGPFPVPGPALVQQADIAVTVTAAHARLVG